MDDSKRLQEDFPGGNAEQIAQQEAIVLENWGILQDRAQERHKQLADAERHFRFMAQARDLLQWSDALVAEMQVETVVRDVAGVEHLRTRHQELSAEISTRDDVFDDVIKSGSTMVGENHFASQDVRKLILLLLLSLIFLHFWNLSQIEAMVTRLEDARKRLRDVWAERKSKLDDTYDQQTFYRDADQLDTLSNSQEVK